MKTQQLPLKTVYSKLVLAMVQVKLFGGEVIVRNVRVFLRVHEHCVLSHVLVVMMSVSLPCVGHHFCVFIRIVIS